MCFTIEGALGRIWELRTGFTPLAACPLQDPGYQPGRVGHTFVVGVSARWLCCWFKKGKTVGMLNDINGVECGGNVDITKQKCNYDQLETIRRLRREQSESKIKSIV